MPRKRRRKPITARRAAKVRGLALAIEEPLHQAIDAVQALRLMGRGLMLDGGEEEGRAVTAAACIACGRLAKVKDGWQKLHKAARGR